MSDAIFVANKASGRLAIGDKKEIDKATWRKPRGVRLPPTSRYIRDKRGSEPGQILRRRLRWRLTIKAQSPRWKKLIRAA